jgi:hypothetical protein
MSAAITRAQPAGSKRNPANRMCLLEPPRGSQVHYSRQNPSIQNFYTPNNILQRKQLLISAIENFRFTYEFLMRHDCLTRTEIVQDPALVLASKNSKGD